MTWEIKVFLINVVISLFLWFNLVVSAKNDGFIMSRMTEILRTMCVASLLINVITAIMAIITYPVLP